MAEDMAQAQMQQDEEMSDKFNLQKMERDFNDEKKDDLAKATKMSDMAREVTEAIFTQTFPERLSWIEDQRKKGNEKFKQDKFEEALDEYTKCLCALDFKSCRGYLDPTTELPKERDKDLEKSLWITRQRENMAQLQMKVPCLNNMGQCLIRQSHFQRAINMFDQVLELDDKNAKATARKLSCLMELGHHEQAENLIRYTSNTIDTFNTSSPTDIQLLRQTIEQNRRILVEKKAEDRKFMQNIFKSGQIYEEKKDVKTPEELEAEAEQRKIIEERIEEAEYLETLNHFHWIVYPWFKLLERACDKVFGCKKKLEEENTKRREEVQSKQGDRQKKRMRERNDQKEESRKRMQAATPSSEGAKKDN